MARTASSLSLALAIACGAAPPLPPPAERHAEDEPPAGESLAEVRLTGVEVTEGDLDVEAARASIGVTRGAVLRCLAGTTLRVHGQLAIGLQVGAAGAVERSEAQNAEGLDPSIVLCVVRGVRSASFPAGAGPSLVRVTLGFVDSGPNVEAAQ